MTLNQRHRKHVDSEKRSGAILFSFFSLLLMVFVQLASGVFVEEQRVHPALLLHLPLFFSFFQCFLAIHIDVVTICSEPALFFSFVETDVVFLSLFR